MNEELKLKPCPFCGCSDISMYTNGSDLDNYSYIVECDGCGCLLDTGFESEERAAEEWNRRKEPERKWTPVTEALPWNDTNVLVTVRDDSGDTPWEYTSVGWRTPDGQYWVVDNEICYGVIAWMPLPEAWREEAQ